MAVTLINPEDIPADLPPGSYCCHLDESTTLADFRVRVVLPPRPHIPGDCLVQIVKEADCTVGGTER
jgi:hypothetical protein